MISDRELLNLITGKKLTIVEIVDRVGTGDRCKKAAISLLRQRLNRMVATGKVRRDRGSDKIFRFQNLEPQKETPLLKLSQKLPPTDPGWPENWTKIWFDCAKKIARTYPIELHVIQP